MSYNYDSLEGILEEASYRLPVNVLGKLITQTENVIVNCEDGYGLERKISNLIAEQTGQKVKAFSLGNLQAANEASNDTNEGLIAA